MAGKKLPPGRRYLYPAFLPADPGDRRRKMKAAALTQTFADEVIDQSPVTTPDTIFTAVFLADPFLI